MTDLQGFKTAIDQSKSILVCLPSQPNQDVVAASLALYLSMRSYGKQVLPIASSKPLVRDSHLVGLDKITADVGGNNLVITFNLPEDAVDKVTSNTEGGHLNLVISPKKDSPAIKAEDLRFGYSGADADLIIVVGAASLSDIGPLAEKEYELFSRAKLVNYGNKPGTYGAVNLTDPSSSNSELTTAVLQELHLPLDSDIANNLMVGIESATNGLSSADMTADTFEALAVLYRVGARRAQPQSFPQAQVMSDMPIVDTPLPLVEAKEAPKLEQAGAPASTEKESVSPDWLRPKVMQTGGKANK